MGMRVCAVAVGAALMALLAPTPATSAAPSSSLVLLYKFDTDTSTAIEDSSPSALTGTLINADPDTAFVSGAPGRNKGLQLVASQQQYVGVPEGNALDVNRYTLTAWVRYTGVSTPETRDRWEVLEKAGAYWLNIRTNGRVRAGGFYGGCENSQYWKYFDSTSVVPTDVWTH
ncbi:MAG: LamG-like jellyroll fold domain-containing protein, partial [Candidatus Nanopelagicales bacterium]